MTTAELRRQLGLKPERKLSRRQRMIARPSRAGDPRSTVDPDPGEPLLTPSGTGRLGHPVGNGLTWGDPGSQSAYADGSEGAASAAQSSGSTYADGSGPL